MSETVAMRPETPRDGVHPLARLALTLGLLYLFLCSIKLMEVSFKMMSAGTEGGLFEGITNPFSALMAGIMATVLVQSSSVTTAAIVALVGSGTLPLGMAVPMVMGANIGTTVTCVLVSIGSVRRSAEFRRAFACATVHDVFNLICVAVLLPLELMTGFLQSTAMKMTEFLSGLGAQGVQYESPIKAAVKAGAKEVEGLVLAIGFEGASLALALLVIAIGLIFLSLAYITKNMRALLINRIEKSLNQVLARSGLMGILIGIIITVSVQS
ncbi:MAG: Na/Pi symporter, partial [Planctomycetota bacterium]|nr:Na/Pi symporter [Planctomycetota bacterium]